MGSFLVNQPTMQSEKVSRRSVCGCGEGWHVTLAFFVLFTMCSRWEIQGLPYAGCVDCNRLFWYIYLILTLFKGINPKFPQRYNRTYTSSTVLWKLVKFFGLCTTSWISLLLPNFIMVMDALLNTYYLNSCKSKNVNNV